MSKDAVVMISDLHIGRKTPGYSHEELHRIMTKLSHLLRHAKDKYDNLHLFLLGDILDGEDIYKGQAYEQEMDINEATEFAFECLFPIVRQADYIHAVPGNHGRVNRGSKANWDAMLYRMLGLHAYRWYDVATIRGLNFLLVHGDNIRMWQQIPFYGIQRTVMRWKSGGMPVDFDIVCMGHFHTVMDVWVNDIRVFVNGTTLRNDDYSARLGLKPTNKFWFIEVSNKGIEWQRLIQV